MAKRILVVDDDRNIVRLVRSYLEQAGYEVIEAGDGEVALHAIRRERPDLVVLDLMLPLLDGRDVTRIVRSDPDLAATPILMLTARVEDVDKIVGLELGADDYVTKPFNPSEVVARVRAILRRSAAPTPSARVIRVRDLEMDVDRHEVKRGDERIALTPTEFQVLERLMTSPGRAFTRFELVDSGEDAVYEGLERTVDTHIKNLRKKIEPDPRNPVYIETVYGVGYRMLEGS
jgi:two-component system alkaline phosphatase synthesis response regulator PhoP